MPGSGALRLGLVARKLISPDKWTDGYPGPDAYIKELDVLLQWADEKGYLDRFRGPIESRNKQRDEAINEIRLAYLLDSLDFPIIQWDPPGANGKIGEFLLDSAEKIPVFTEIKSPGWESELTAVQIKAGRAQQPKFMGLQGGAVGNWQAVHRCISSSKTYPKFTDNQSNLLIVSDDLRLSLHDSLFQVENALYADKSVYGIEGYFMTNQYENIGGLAVFNCSSSESRDGLEYQFVVYENPCALPATQLPPSLTTGRSVFRCFVRGTQKRTGV